MHQVLEFATHHASQGLSLAATLTAGLFTLFAWLTTQRDKARKRDHELFDWGCDVIRTMSEIETQAAEIRAGQIGQPFPTGGRETLLDLKSRSSALVDQGRPFFPNVKQSRRQRADGTAAFKGTRVAVLDEVVRAFMVARHLCDHGPPQDEVLREQMRRARRRFVTHLQREMGRSLRRPPVDAAGESVPRDPYQWER